MWAGVCKGAYEKIERLPADYEAGERLAFIRKMADEHGVNPSAMVIAWLLNLYKLEGYPRVIPLFSATTSHLVDNLRGLDIELSVDELKAMNNVM